MLNSNRYIFKKNFLVKKIEEVTVKEDIKPENLLEESEPTEENLTKLEGKQIN